MIAALVAATLAQWRVERRIHTPAHPSTVAFTVPASVYSHAQSDLSDLRIMSNGEIIPYAIVLAPRGTTERYDAAPHATGRTNGVTYYALDHIGNVPIERIDVVTTTPSYVRSVELQGSDGSEWKTIAWGTLIRTKTRNVQALRFPESRYQTIRLLIYDRDDPSLETLSIEAYGTPRRVVFDAYPNRSYELYYGNRSMKAPHFDYSQTHHITWASGEIVYLGAPHEQTWPKAPARELPPWILWAALAVASVGVLWLAVRSTAT